MDDAVAGAADAAGATARRGAGLLQVAATVAVLGRQRRRCSRWGPSLHVESGEGATQVGGDELGGRSMRPLVRLQAGQGTEILQRKIGFPFPGPELTYEKTDVKSFCWLSIGSAEMRSDHGPVCIAGRSTCSLPRRTRRTGISSLSPRPFSTASVLRPNLR